jgi:A/G-specific adenine glycosylase
MLIIRNTEGAIMLERRALSGLWGGLFSFPECTQKELASHLKNIQGRVIRLTSFRHGFTHFDLDIQPILIELSGPFRQFEESQTRWISTLQGNNIGMAGPVTRLLAELL